MSMILDKNNEKDFYWKWFPLGFKSFNYFPEILAYIKDYEGNKYLTMIDDEKIIVYY